MGFKIGDIIICILAESKYDKDFDLEFGEKYIVTDVLLTEDEISSVTTEYSNLKIKKLNNGTDRDFIGFFCVDRFIHENDWISRIKYGV